MQRRIKAGFTLIELLVVVAIIALLIGVLLPALGQARSTAQAIVNSNLQRQLATGMIAYASASEDYYPGINSSGIKLRAPNQYAANTARLDQDGTMPTQSWDWMTPSVDAELPANRVARMWQLFETFADPAQKERVPVFAGGGPGSSEAADYADSQGQGFRAVSYLMPAAFQWAGRSIFQNNPNGPSVQTQVGNQFPNPVTVPRSFIPRLDKIAAPSSKIAIADGFRYFDTSTIDFDASIIGGTYGSFTDTGPIYKSSTAYGLPGDGNRSDGQNIPLSYRHNGKMSAAHWDGHAEMFTGDQSRDPTLWYPTGSIFTGVDACQKAFDYYRAGQTLN